MCGLCVVFVLRVWGMPSTKSLLQNVVLETIFNIFRIGIPKTSADPFAREQNAASKAQASGTTEQASRTLMVRHSLLDNFLALLLIAFMHADLFEVCCGAMAGSVRSSFA